MKNDFDFIVFYTYFEGIFFLYIYSWKSLFNHLLLKYFTRSPVFGIFISDVDVWLVEIIVNILIPVDSIYFEFLFIFIYLVYI